MSAWNGNNSICSFFFFFFSAGHVEACPPFSGRKKTNRCTSSLNLLFPVLTQHRLALMLLQLMWLKAAERKKWGREGATGWLGETGNGALWLEASLLWKHTKRQSDSVWQKAFGRGEAITKQLSELLRKIFSSSLLCAHIFFQLQMNLLVYLGDFRQRYTCHTQRETRTG